MRALVPALASHERVGEVQQIMPNIALDDRRFVEKTT